MWWLKYDRDPKPFKCSIKPRSAEAAELIKQSAMDADYINPWDSFLLGHGGVLNTKCFVLVYISLVSPWTLAYLILVCSISCIIPHIFTICSLVFLAGNSHLKINFGHNYSFDIQRWQGLHHHCRFRWLITVDRCLSAGLWAMGQKTVKRAFAHCFLVIFCRKIASLHVIHAKDCHDWGRRF